MDLLPWVFSSGWASGINGYVVVLILGGPGRRRATRCRTRCSAATC